MQFSTQDSVGVVGAGAMGFPIMRYLLRAGFRVACCETDPGRRAEAKQLGARPASSVHELADCSVILVLVPTDEDVRAVAAEYAGVASSGSFLVICSSVRTETCRSIAAELKDRDIHVVDAALTGGVRGAETGQINLLVGGDIGDVNDLAEVFKPWTSHVNHLGELGCGQIGKTVNNLIHWAQIVVLAEALSLGAELGVPPSLMRPALVAGPSDSRTLRELEDMRFTWYEKDIDNAKEMAATVNRELVLSRYVQKLMRSVTVAGMADLLADEGVIELSP